MESKSPFCSLSVLWSAGACTELPSNAASLSRISSHMRTHCHTPPRRAAGADHKVNRLLWFLAVYCPRTTYFRFHFPYDCSNSKTYTLVTQPDGAPKKLLSIISQRVYLFAYRGRNFQVGKIISVKSREFQLYNVFVRFLRCIKFC